MARLRRASASCRTADSAFAAGDTRNGERMFWDDVHDITYEVDEALKGRGDGEVRIRLYRSVAAVELALHTGESNAHLHALVSQVCDDLRSAGRLLDGS